MSIIFIVKGRRTIRLPKERWQHILIRHPDVTNLNLIRDALENPSFIRQDAYNNSVHYYYKYIKENQEYLQVAVKYLNGNGFVITSFFTKKIKK